MALIGLKYPVVGKYNESGGTVSHTDGMVLAKAIQANMSINIFSTTLYADDGLSESDKGFQEGTIDLNIDDLSQEAAKFIFGASEAAGGVTGDDTTKMLVYKGDDDVPDVGVGFYAPRKKSGARSYRAIFFPRVKFGYPNETLDTKGVQLTYGTPTIQGAIQLDATGEWKREITVADEAKAVAWLKTQAGIT
jgi:phi13 family phage major tail protein